MTREQLDAIRARVEAATPGPWGIDDEFVVFSHSAIFADGFGYEQHVRVCEMPHWLSSGMDIDLVTNAPTDLRALLAEVERLTLQVTALESALTCPASEYGHRCIRCDSEVEP